MKNEYLASPPVIREFLMYMETVKNRSKKTVINYFADLRIFFRFLKIHYELVEKPSTFEEIPIDKIDAEFLNRITLSDVYQFLIYCKNERSNNDKSRARRVSTLKQYFNYLTQKTNILKINPVEQLDAPKTKKSLPKYLTLEQSKTLLSSVDGKNRERDYAILTVFLNCGLRLSELCSLNINDINEEDKTMRVTGKGSKERMVYINQSCFSAIQNLLRVRPRDGVKDKNALFLSSRLTRISNRTVQHIVYHYLDKSGIGRSGFSVHKLRHTAATLMYQHGGVDIRVLKDVLGHENLGTTEIYTHLSNEQLKKASDANPLADFK